VAVLSGANVVQQWSNGEAERVTLYALRHVTAGDTFDLSSDFNPPTGGTIIGTVGAAAGAVASLAGNVVTIPTGPSNSGGYLLVFGVHA
jgi:hypothetical protein